MAVPDNIFVAKNGIDSLGVILSSGVDISSIFGGGGGGDVSKGYLSQNYLPLSGGTITGNVVLSSDLNDTNLTLIGQLTSTGTAYFSSIRIGHYDGEESENYPSSIASFHALLSGRGIVDMHNESSDPLASTDLILSNDIGSESTYFIDLGFTSSQYNVGVAMPMFPILKPSTGYLYASDADFLFGIAQPQYNMRFIVGGGQDQYEIYRLDVNRMTMAKELSTVSIIKTLSGDSNRWDGTSTFVTGNSAYLVNSLTDLSTVSGTFVISGGPYTQGIVRLLQQDGNLISVDTGLTTSSTPTFSALTVTGNLSVLGDLIYIDTIITTTSALSVVNSGTGPALTVVQKGNNQPIATFIDSEGGAVTIQDGGLIVTDTSDSNKWSNAYTYTNSKSALIEGDLTNIANTSGFWNTAYSNMTWLTGNSASITDVVANSANWNSAYTYVNSNSALIEGDLTNIATTSGTWNSTWTYSTTYSASNLAVATNVTTNSANWSNAYSYINGTSALIEGDLTALAVASGDWNKVNQGLFLPVSGGNLFGPVSSNNSAAFTSISGLSGRFTGVGGIGNVTIGGAELTPPSNGNYFLKYNRFNTSSSGIAFDYGGNATLSFWNNGGLSFTTLGGISLPYGNNLFWGASPTGGSITLGLSGQSTSNIIEINNATAGAVRDLKLRDLYANTIYLSSGNSNNWNQSYSYFTWLTSNSAFILPTDITANSANWSNAYSYVNSKSALIEGDLTNLANTSGAWNSSWTNAYTYSGSNLAVATNVTTNSANWNTAYSNFTWLTANSSFILPTDITANSANWSNAYSYVNSKSALIEGDLTNIANTSATWNSSWTYAINYSASNLAVATNVTTNSANWNTAYTYTNDTSALIEGDLTNLAVNSAKWDSTWTNAYTYSASNLATVTVVNSNSGFWNQSYSYFTWLTGNSGNSGFVLPTDITANSANWSNAYLYVNGTSALIEGDLTNIALNSAYWELAYDRSTVYANNSASYATSNWVETNFLSTTGGEVSGYTSFVGDVTVYGTLCALSGLNFVGSTIFTTSSSLSIINTGPGPALYVKQAGAVGELAIFADQYGTVLHVETKDSSVEGGGVGILTDAPNRALTVNGDISATAIVIASGLDIGRYETGVLLPNVIGQFTDSVDDYLQINIQNTNSGNFASSDYVATADDGSDNLYYVDMGINSSTYSDPEFTVVGPHDGYFYNDGGNLALGTEKYNDLVLFTGGTLLSNIQMVVSASGEIGVGVPYPNSNLIDKFTVNGAISSNSRITADGGNSVFWNTAYSNMTWLTANSGTGQSSVGLSTDITANTGKWNSVYSTVTAGSAIWDTSWTYATNYSASNLATVTIVNNNSGRWDSTWTNAYTYSGSNLAVATNVTLNSAGYSYGTIYSASNLAAVTLVNNNSAVWDSAWTNAYTYSASNLATVTVVNGISAFWNTAYSNMTWLTANSGQSSAGLSTDITANTGKWNSVYSTVTAGSAIWDASWLYSATYSASNLAVATNVTLNSAGYSYGTIYSASNLAVATDVTANSANWGVAFTYTNSKSALIEDDLTNIAVNSAKWDAAWTYGTQYSAGFISSRNLVNSNSAVWDSAWTNAYTYSGSNLAVATTVTTTSAIWNAAWTYAIDYSASNLATVAKVTANSAFWDTAYSNMTWLTANSGTGSTGGLSTDITANTGKWNSVYSTVTAGSGIWNAAWTYAINYSASNLATVTEVTTNSALWNQSYSYFTWLTANSGTGQTGGGLSTDVTNNTGKWLSVYSTVTAGSGIWDAAWTYAIDYSASNLATVTYVTSNSGSDIAVNSVVATKSAFWNSSYSVLTANSGTWSAKLIKSITLESPEPGDAFTILYTTEAFTLSASRAVVRGTTPTAYATVYYTSDRSALGTVVAASTNVTNTTVGQNMTLTNATIPANNWVYLSAGTTTGTVNEIHISLLQ
jgi:hypothetical protein